MGFQSFYAHGKLLLSGEYAVLDGALALAIPTQFGQKMEVNSIESDTEKIYWESFDLNGNCWLNTNLQNLDNDVEVRLHQLLSIIRNQKPELFKGKTVRFRMDLEFPNNWGLGSSSTLLSLLAQWSGVNAFELLKHSFGGSGYDIACAQNDTPIVYQLNNGNPIWSAVNLNGPWISNAYFLFLEQKKNSREAIQHYKQLEDTHGIVADVSALTIQWQQAETFDEVYAIIEAHEALMSITLQLESINKQFEDFNGICKSLGGWGGDFILVLSKENIDYIKNYFAAKGFNTLLPYNEMIWKQQ